MEKISSFFFTTILLVSFAMMINGCATIFGWGGSELVNIRSKPDQANITITDESGTKIFEGKTPTNVQLKKKKGYFSGKTYTLIISKDGYTEKTVTIDTKANGWYIGGNLVFGGLIGWLVVDPLTGAMWTLSTNDVNVTLEKSKHASINGTRIMLLQDVPNTLRSKMVKVKE